MPIYERAPTLGRAQLRGIWPIDALGFAAAQIAGALLAAPVGRVLVAADKLPAQASGAFDHRLTTVERPRGHDDVAELV